MQRGQDSRPGSEVWGAPHPQPSPVAVLRAMELKPPLIVKPRQQQIGGEGTGGAEMGQGRVDGDDTAATGFAGKIQQSPGTGIHTAHPE